MTFKADSTSNRETFFVVYRFPHFRTFSSPYSRPCWVRIPLARPRHRWKGNIRMNFKEIGINTRNWVDLVQNRDYWKVVENAALDLRVS